jgi:sulfiredoxin
MMWPESCPRAGCEPAVALSIEWANFVGEPIVCALARFAGTTQVLDGLAMEKKIFGIDDIYVPVKRRKTLNLEDVKEIAESILENGQQIPIMVRRDGDRLVLVDGLHRLEACRALGERTVEGFIVQARLH